VGLVLVVGLLLVAGTLAVSGGGILNSGGRLGVNPVESTAPGPAANGDPVDGPIVTAPPDEGTETGSEPNDNLRTSFDYTCDADAIADLSRGKWLLTPFTAGSRPADGYDQVTFSLTRQGKKAKNAVIGMMEWMDPNEARSRYGAPTKIQGSRALVITFDGQVDINVNQTIDSLLLERESVNQIRNIQMFEGSDGKAHAAIGLRGDACARMEAKNWSKKSKAKKAKVLLQVERFE
jgi:hypothetical protein